MLSVDFYDVCVNNLLDVTVTARVYACVVSCLTSGIPGTSFGSAASPSVLKRFLKVMVYFFLSVIPSFILHLLSQILSQSSPKSTKRTASQSQTTAGTCKSSPISSSTCCRFGFSAIEQTHTHTLFRTIYRLRTVLRTDDVVLSRWIDGPSPVFCLPDRYITLHYITLLSTPLSRATSDQ